MLCASSSCLFVEVFIVDVAHEDCVAGHAVDGHEEDRDGVGDDEYDLNRVNV